MNYLKLSFAELLISFEDENEIRKVWMEHRIHIITNFPHLRFLGKDPVKHCKKTKVK